MTFRTGICLWVACTKEIAYVLYSVLLIKGKGEKKFDKIQKKMKIKLRVLLFNEILMKLTVEIYQGTACN